MAATVTPRPLADKRIGRLRRNSTPRQKGNWNSVYQEEVFDTYLIEQGATVVPFDEQAISGRDLGKRKVATRLIEEVEQQRLDGIAVTVLDRLSRDEHGVDPGIFAEALIKVRGLLVTFDRIYRLWEKEDLKLYRILTGLAGTDVLEIRDRMWMALLTKAQEEPFLMGVPPIGYRTVTAGRGAGPISRRKRDRSRPARDEAMAPVMAALAGALDACTAIGEVVAVLNTAEHYRCAQYGGAAGRRVKWQTGDIRRILAHPLYGGVWHLGRASDGTSTVWDAARKRGLVDHRTARLSVPELAWFTPAQLERWQAKYAGEGPRGRHRRYAHPLRGLFTCASCARPLIGYGAHGYGCPDATRRPLPGAGTHCAHPLVLAEAPAFRLLRELLPAALRARSEYDAELRLRAQQREERDALDLQLAMRTRQIEALVTRWYPDDDVLDVPDEVVAKLARWKRERDALERERQQLREAATGGETQQRTVDALLADPNHGLDADDLGQQARLLRLVFANVRVAGMGRGGGRRYEVRGYDNLLLGSTQVTGGSASTWVQYLSSCAPAAA